MQIKYYRLGTGEILPCIEDNGKYYKLYINPNYVIDKSSWDNFTETEPICCPLNMSRDRQKQWYEDNYIDKSNLIGNVHRVIECYKDAEAMNVLLAQGVVTPEHEDYNLNVHYQTYRTSKNHPIKMSYYRITKVCMGRTELPLRRAFDTYDEIMEYTVNVVFDDNYIAEAFDETPPEMTHALRALADAMPSNTQFQWEAPELRIRTFKGDYYTLYEVPEDWTPDWWRYPSRKAAIDYFLHLNRRRPPKNRERLLAFMPQWSNRQVLNHVLRPLLGKPVADYIGDRQCEEMKLLKIEHPDWELREILDYMGLAEKYKNSNSTTFFINHTGQPFTKWWEEYCEKHGLPKPKRKKKKKGT